MAEFLEIWYYATERIANDSLDLEHGMDLFTQQASEFTDSSCIPCYCSCTNDHIHLLPDKLAEVLNQWQIWVGS